MKNLFVLVILGLSFSSCSNLNPKFDLLKERMEAYSYGLRWNSFNTSLAMVDEKKQQEMGPQISKQLSKEKVTEYRVSGLEMEKGTGKAKALVIYNFVDQETQSLQSRIEMQHWAYVADKRNWYLQDIETRNK